MKLSHNIYLNSGWGLQTMLLEQTKNSDFQLEPQRALPIWGVSFLYLSRLLGTIMEA